MKNTIRLMVALALCALTFVGCTKDEDAKIERKIVGTWQVTRYWYLDAFSGQYEEGDEGGEWEKYSFRGNGSGTAPIWNMSTNEADEEVFRYTIVDNRIRLEYVDWYWYDELLTEIYTIETISSKRMMWIDEDGDKMEFKKIR